MKTVNFAYDLCIDIVPFSMNLQIQDPCVQILGCGVSRVKQADRSHLQIYNLTRTLNVSPVSPTAGRTQKTTARGLSQSLTSYTHVCVNQSLPGFAPAFPAADLIFSGVLNA